MSDEQRALLVALNCVIQKAAHMQQLVLQPAPDVPGGNWTLALDGALGELEGYMNDLQHWHLLFAAEE